MEIDKIRAENKRFQDDLNIALTANVALEAESAELKILVAKHESTILNLQKELPATNSRLTMRRRLSSEQTSVSNTTRTNY